VLTVVPNVSLVHDLSEVDRLARWLAEAAVERESDGVPLSAETTAQLALLSAPGVLPIDENEWFSHSPPWTNRGT
jgi:hypothetical protein